MADPMMTAVRVTVVGQMEPQHVTWPDNLPIPHEGDMVYLAEGGWYVRTVAYYPQGKPDEDITEPFVYVVLGPRRPEWLAPQHGPGWQGTPERAPWDYIYDDKPSS